MFESILLKQQLHKVLCQFIVWINTVDQESPTSLELHVLCNKKKHLTSWLDLKLKHEIMKTWLLVYCTWSALAYHLLLGHTMTPF